MSACRTQQQLNRLDTFPCLKPVFNFVHYTTLHTVHVAVVVQCGVQSRCKPLVNAGHSDQEGTGLKVPQTSELAQGPGPLVFIQEGAIGDFAPSKK